MTKKCPNCGKNIDNNANFCINCGSKQTKEAEIKEEKTTTVESTNSVPVSGLSITGFVLSLVSLICCGLTSPLGLIFSIIGLVKGDPDDKTGKGLAIAGIIISGILLLLFIMSLVVWNSFFDLVEKVWDDPNFTTEWNNIVSGFIVR